MSKEKQEKRFVQVFSEDCGFVVDRETGVTYLIIRNTFGSGITPLLNSDGKPVITKPEDTVTKENKGTDA